MLIILFHNLQQHLTLHSAACYHIFYTRGLTYVIYEDMLVEIEQEIKFLRISNNFNYLLAANGQPLKVYFDSTRTKAYKYLYYYRSFVLIPRSCNTNTFYILQFIVSVPTLQM
jgi:hypothetical protein